VITGRGLGRDTDVLGAIVADGLGRQPLEVGGHWEYVGAGGIQVGGSALTSGPAVEIEQRGGPGAGGIWTRVEPPTVTFGYIGSGSIAVSGAAEITRRRVYRGRGQVLVAGSAETSIDRTRSTAYAIDDDFLMLAA
jgi:hypothetical protein